MRNSGVSAGAQRRTAIIAAVAKPPGISNYRVSTGFNPMTMKFLCILGVLSTYRTPKLAMLGHLCAPWAWIFAFPEHIYPEIKGRWLNEFVFDFRGGEINFFDLSIIDVLRVYVASFYFLHFNLFRVRVLASSCVKKFII